MERKQSTPRLPDSYYSTYRQYKQNDGIILRWVHMTAAELRERSRIHTNQPSRGRAQGKRGRGAGTKRSEPTISAADITSPQIPLRVFLQNVREIAASNVVIPTSYIALLEASVKQRKLTASFYSPDAEALEKNRAHMFAIKAYSQALVILKEAQQKRAEKDGGLADEIRNSLSLQDGDNVFALSEAIHQLAVVVEAEGFGGSASVGSPDNEWLRDNPMLNSSKSGSRHQKPQPFPLEEYELVPDDQFDAKLKKKKPDDSSEALRCFLLDVHRVRQFCNHVWSSVIPAGNTTHIAASFVTNKAVQLVKEMEYALVADFPVLEDMSRAFDVLLQVLTFQLPNATYEQVYSFKEKIMWHTWAFLKEFAKMLNVNPMPILRDGHYGYFDPMADRNKMPFVERFLEDKCLMGNHWPDLILLNRSTSSFIGDQGLAKDFGTFYDDKSRPVTWALVFACQMQADGVIARRRYLNYDLQVMRNLGRNIIAEYDAFMDDGVLYDNNMDDVAKPYITQQRIQVGTWLESDPLTDLKIKNGFDKLSKQSSQKDSLWLQNSWLTANAISEATLDYFFAGTAVVGAGGFVQSAIQLWNILRQTGYLTSLQPSTSVIVENSTSMKEHIRLFDHLLDVFSDKVFSGPPPKSGFLKQWELMMGVRPEEFARGKRQYKKTSQQPLRPRAHNEAGRGIMVTDSELWNMHNNNYFPQKTKQVSDKQYRHPLAATLDLVNSELGQLTPSTSRQRTSDSKMQQSRGPLLNLNLLKIHRLCFRIFAELEPILRPDIERIIGEPLEHSQINWPYLTGWIAQTELLAGNNGIPDRVLLRKAADVMERLAGSKELGFFLMREEADECLVL